VLLAVEYEELEKEREAFAQENKFSKTKSASPTQVTCRRFEQTDHHGRRQQANHAEDNGHHPNSSRGSQTTHTNWQVNLKGAAVVRSGDDWWEQLQCHNRHRGNGKLR